MMSDAVIIAILGAVTTVVGAWLNYKIEKIHKQINSRMTEFLEATKALGTAEGNAAGRKEQKAETKSRREK